MRKDVCPLPLAVIYGGAGNEREISKVSAEFFLSAAARSGVPMLRIFIDKDGSFYIEKDEKRIPTYPVLVNSESGFLSGSEIISVSAAFPILHGDLGEDGRVQGALSTAGIRIFGADTLSGAICSDKAYTKMIAEACGVKTAPFVTLIRDEGCSRAIARAEELGYPLFIKPTSLGSSIGANEARNIKELRKALECAFSYSERVLAERLIEDKRELECAYFSVGDKRLISPPAEVLVKGFYDYDTKYRLPARTLLRARVSEKISKRLIGLTDTLAVALSVRHIARFDYFLLPDGEILFNEVNTCPGMTDSSLYPRMLDSLGVSPEELAKIAARPDEW